MEHLWIDQHGARYHGTSLREVTQRYHLKGRRVPIRGGTRVGTLELIRQDGSENKKRFEVVLAYDVSCYANVTVFAATRAEAMREALQAGESADVSFKPAWYDSSEIRVVELEEGESE